MNSLSNNLFVGKVSTQLDSVDSTNEFAKLLLSKNKPPEGAVIIAREQTLGKGQFGKTWESESGKNLTFSVILYPVFLEARSAFRLNQAVCLALKDAVGSLGIPVRIKWPNDIYAHDKKIAGILIENGLLSENLSYSVIGIGLNVNQTEFSPELPNPSSLKIIAGKDFDLEKLMIDIFSYIEQRYLQLIAGRHREMHREFSKSLYRLDEMGSYRMADNQFDGIIRGVDYEGRLIIEVNGTNRAYERNEIVYL